jgi:DNA-binding CsgD family transcriptional regulator
MTLSRPAVALRHRVRAAAIEAADSADYRSRVLAAIETVVPFDSACVASVDPATLIPTALTTVGYDDPEAVLRATESEYGPDPPVNSFRSVARLDTPVRLSRAADPDGWASSRHYRTLLAPFGLHDELRMVFPARDGRAWGMATMSRGPGVPFDECAVRVLSSSLRDIGEGMRTTLLRRSGPDVSAVPDEVGWHTAGPAVVVVGPDATVVDATPQADRVLQEIGLGVAAPMMAALRLRRGDAEPLRLRSQDGRWLLLRAGPLGRDRVAVTIQDAQPPEVVSLVAAVHGLTAREAEVLAEVLAGHSRDTIAQVLHLSPYTVQDHLKSIFAKTGVNSRQGLVCQLVLDQYVPRLGRPVGPRGWFGD